jgi:lysophospholipase L1-like esterase
MADDRTMLGGPSVALVGDSHMEALGPRLRRALIAKGARHVLVEANRGKSARWYSRTSEGRAALRRARAADVVIVELGGNNREFDRDTYLSMMGSVIAQVSGPGAKKVIWVGPPASNPARAPEVAEFHEKTSRLQTIGARAAGASRWIDSRPMTRSGWAPDGVHFTRDGYDRWASSLMKKLESSTSPILIGSVLGLLGFFGWKALRSGT